MFKREGIYFLDYSEDPQKGISLERNRVQTENLLTTSVLERILENRGFYRHRSFDEKEGHLRSSSVSYPLSGGTSVEYEFLYVPEKKRYSEISIDVTQAGVDRLGLVWYDEEGLLTQVCVYPLASGYQKLAREIEAEGIDWTLEERVNQLDKLTSNSPLEILPLKGKMFFLKGVLQETPEKTVDVGIAKSGEMVFWDEYYYKITEEENRLIIEVFSGTKERVLKKRLIFPLEIKDYKEVLKLFTQDDADWRKIPELIPVEVDFPASA